MPAIWLCQAACWKMRWRRANSSSARSLFAPGMIAMLAMVRRAQGRLEESRRMAEQALALASYAGRVLPLSGAFLAYLAAGAGPVRAKRAGRGRAHAAPMRPAGRPISDDNERDSGAVLPWAGAGSARRPSWRAQPGRAGRGSGPALPFPAQPARDRRLPGAAVAPARQPERRRRMGRKLRARNRPRAAAPDRVRL